MNLRDSKVPNFYGVHTFWVYYMLQYITPSDSTTPLMKESILGTGKTHGSDLAVMKE